MRKIIAFLVKTARVLLVPAYVLVSNFFGRLLVFLLSVVTFVLFMTMKAFFFPSTMQLNILQVLLAVLCIFFFISIILSNIIAHIAYNADYKEEMEKLEASVVNE